MRRGPGTARAAHLLLLALLVAAGPAPEARSAAEGGPADEGGASEALARADAHWAARAEGAQDGRPARAPIEAAIDGYAEAARRDAASLEARWKLVRALHFAGEFLERDREAKRRRFERATEVAEASLDLLAERVGSDERLDRLEPDEVAARLDGGASGVSDPAAARVHFWAGIAWGAWSRTVGLLSAVRQGVAGRLHRYTAIAVRLEPGYERGGPLRLLGSLNAELPRVPFVTGWVDRDAALPLVERAVAIAPDDPGNELLLARTLLAVAPERRDEAAALLRNVASLSPRPDMQIEDLALRRDARERLDSMGASDGSDA